MAAKKLKPFDVFGVFTGIKWYSTALTNKGRNCYLPVMLLPFHMFWLRGLFSGDLNRTNCGPYTLMLDTWRSMGTELSQISLVSKQSSSGSNIVVANFSLRQESPLGINLGQTVGEPMDAAILSVLTNKPIMVNPDVAAQMACPVPENIENNEDLLEFIQRQLVDFEKNHDFFTSLMKSLPMDNDNDGEDNS